MVHEANISIEPFRAEQIEAAYRLRKEVTFEELVAVGVSPEHAEAHIVSWGPDEEAIAEITQSWTYCIERPDRYCMQAVTRDSELVGVFMGSLAHVDRLGAAKYVDFIQLSSSIRGMGFGSRLMANFMLFGSDDDITLHAYATNKRVQAFYNRLGFVDTGQGQAYEIGDYSLMQNLLLKRIRRDHEI